MKQQILADLSQKYEEQINSMQIKIDALLADKHNLQEAIKKLEVDGKKVGVGFKTAKDLTSAETKIKFDISNKQAPELFYKAREFMKSVIRNDPRMFFEIKVADDGNFELGIVRI